jgi:hypothetical protein
LVVKGDQLLRSPLDMLAPLTKLTALHLECFAPSSAAPAAPALPSLPPDLALLTALRELRCEGFSAPSARNLSSLLSPLTQLTELHAGIVLGGSCRLPQLPHLQSLHVERVAKGGLSSLAASCTALTSLHTLTAVRLAKADAAARLPALHRLVFLVDSDLITAVQAGRFSLAAFCPALAGLHLFAEVLDNARLVPLLKGLSGLAELTAAGPLRAWGAVPATPLVSEWQALAALPSLRSFAATLKAVGSASLPAFAAGCTQLTELRLTLELRSDELDGCVAFAGAMEGSRVQLLTLTPKFESNTVNPLLPMPFYAHLAAWRRLEYVKLRHWCTLEQVAVLCGGPRIDTVSIDRIELTDRGTPANVLQRRTEQMVVQSFVNRIMVAHSSKELEIRYKPHP